MNEAPRPVSRSHRARLAKTLFPLAITLVLASVALSACAGSPFSSAKTAHACSDKVAQEVAFGKTVAGVWNCFDPNFQATLATNGLPTNDQAFVYPNSDATQLTYVGQHGDMVVYDVVVTANSKTVSVALIVWVDPDGLVKNLNASGYGF